MIQPPSRFVIIAHDDPVERRISLADKPKRHARLLSQFYRWNKVTHQEALWEELSLAAHLAGVASEPFTIWEMPLFTGLHLHALIRSTNPQAEILLINHLSADNRDHYFDQIRAFAPDCILLSTTFYLTLPHLNQVLERLHNHFPAIPVVAGGHFVAKELLFTEESTLMATTPPGVHYVLSRFGETELIDILRGVITLETAGVQLKSLDSPDPEGRPIDYDGNDWVLDYAQATRLHRVLPVRTAVGCSFRCAFCSYPVTSGIFAPTDVEQVIRQLTIIHQSGVRQVHFLDDTINVPVKRFRLFLAALEKANLEGMRFFSFLRCQHIDEEMVASMKRCGWEGVLLGLESGANSILVNMNKAATTTQYLRGIELLAKYDIRTFGAVIIGFPGETRETVKETVTFLNQSALDYCYVQPFYYLHNSPIHQQREQFGLSGQGMTWKHDTMSSDECLELLDELFFEVTKPIHVNEEYAMWEYLYLLQKGLAKEDYANYRRMINTLRAQDINTHHGTARPYPHALSVEAFQERSASWKQRVLPSTTRDCPNP
ncbi:MAG: radical SAM protein [Magnetococcales bacterium]|nr:radical SAM protein [Magnetococcales bacterium]